MFKDNYNFVDEDGDELEVAMNYSFGYPSITIFAEEGVRLRIEDADNLVRAIQSFIEKARNKQNN